jgi:hypothetical protein
MSLYAVAIRYLVGSQKMQMGLHYRDADVFPVDLDVRTACQQLGAKVRDSVIVSVMGQTRLENFMAAGVNFTHVAVNRLDANTHKPEMLSAVEVPVNIVISALNAGEMGAPEITAILNFKAGTRSISPTDYEPKRGYIAIGPIPASRYLPNGQLKSDSLQALDNFGAALIAPLDIGGGFVVKPIIVGKHKILGVTQLGFSDIADTSPRPTITWRRSRSGV